MLNPPWEHSREGKKEDVEQAGASVETAETKVGDLTSSSLVADMKKWF